MRKLVTLFIFTVLVASQLSAQTRLIKGKVTDEKGNTVENVSVTVKGASQGSNTDATGSFSLNVPTSSKSLVFTALNFENVEVVIGNKTVINVVLKSTTQNLQEVVVVGYGTKKKSDLTGSVTTLKSAEIENKPFTSVDKALQGKVAGLQSVASSGQPGANQAILIRGVSSISASTSPLWVVDGVPVNSGDASRLQTTANLLSTLNPNDIESISVLKDAASQSIYGSRAANGVIVVTTKKGKSGVTKYRFDTEIGTSQTAYSNPNYRPLDVNEYMDVTAQGYLNAGYTQAQTTTQLNALGFGNGTNFDWLSHVTRVGQQQQYNLSAEGGNDKTTFFISGGRFTADGTTINSQFARTNGNIRLTHKATDRLTLNVNFNGGYVNQRAPLNGGAFGNPVLSSYFLLPSRSAYNQDGSWNFNLGGLHNTIALAELDKRFLRQASLRGNMSAEYRILDNLRLKTSYGLDYNTEEEDQYNNPLHGDGAATNGRAFAYYTRYFNYISTTTLDYQQNLTKNGDLSSNFQLGYEGQKSQSYLTGLQSQQFPPTLALTYPSSGASPITASAYTSDYTFASEFASGSINYQNRFVLSGSFRRDGSSRFSAANRYGNFWSVGGTWNLDREKFIQDMNVFSQLKIRSSYGVNGNAGIGNYDALALYGYGYNYNQLPGSAPSNVGDASLTWELNKPFNVGVDFSILKNRINVTAEYYNRKSEDLLLAVPLSRTTGFASATRNIGAMENKGLELTINVIPVLTKDFKWDVDFNFANNQNKITSLPGGADIADGNFIIRQGASYKTFYLRSYAGVNPANGDPQWYTDDTKQNVTNVYSNATRGLVGSALPKAFGSLTNSFTYKQFTLSAQLYYNYGNYVYDTYGSYYAGAGFGPTYGKVARVLEAWKQPGDVTTMPKYVANGNKSFQSGSTFWYNQGDYIRLRDVQFAYNLPKTLISKYHLSNANIYVRGTNLFTWVKDSYLPFDPEQGTTSTTNLNVFIPKTVTFGVNLAF